MIERRYHDERLTVSGLSRDIFTSRRQLQRSFAEAGTSVRERLHGVRMERAAELLRESSLSVAEIGRRVGYRQPAQFTKAFRRYYGLAPAHWRNRVGRSPAIGELVAMECRCGCETSTRPRTAGGSRPTRDGPRCDEAGQLHPRMTELDPAA